MTTTCTHLDQIQALIPHRDGCEECLRTGDDWVHLRLCLTCGHVGCCDDSKNKHATAHFHSTGHPVIESLEPGEGWRWCYVDEVLIPSEIDGADAPAVERENVMLDDTRSPISVIDGTTLLPRHFCERSQQRNVQVDLPAGAPVQQEESRTDDRVSRRDCSRRSRGSPYRNTLHLWRLR